MFRLLVLALCLSLGHGLDDEACGVDSPRIVDASEPGIISSPGYDDDEPYPADSSCEWLLQGDVGQTVEFKLLSVEIELCTSCRCDVLKIYDGDGPQHLLDEVCGNQGAGQVYQSSGDYGDALYIVFESDDLYHFSGFMGRYGYPFQEIACTVDQPEMMTSDVGVLTSPDWPAPYADNSECSWHISVPDGQVIMVNFGDFDIEECCLCDYVEFFDGEDATAQRIGRYYGRNTLPPDMMSSGNHMYVTFRSDVTIDGRGFSVRYQAMPAQ